MQRSTSGILFLTVFLDLVGFGIVLPLLSLYAREHRAAEWEIGMLMATYSLFQFLFAPVWGRLSDRVGRRPVLLISIGGSSLSYLLFAFAPSLPWLFLSRAVAGVMAANIATAQACVADTSAPEDRARGMGMIGAAIGMGFVFGPVIAGLLGYVGERLPPALVGPAPHAGPQWMVGMGAACFSLLDLFLVARFLPETLPPEARSRARAARGSRIARMGAALRSPGLGLPVTLFFLTTVAWSQLEPTLVLLGREQYGFRTVETSLVFAYVGIIAAGVQGGLAGRLSRRLGEGRMVVAGTLCAALGMLGVSAAGSLGSLLAVLALLAGGHALTLPALQSLISRGSAAEEQGSSLGVAQGFSSLARVLGPAAGGWLFGLRHAYPFWLGAALMLLGCLLACRLLSPGPLKKSGSG